MKDSLSVGNTQTFIEHTLVDLKAAINALNEISYQQGWLHIHIHIHIIHMCIIIILILSWLSSLLLP